MNRILAVDVGDVQGLGEHPRPVAHEPDDAGFPPLRAPERTSRAAQQIPTRG